ncbi:hypothetical protein B0T14DRAFT_564807 [Immersiella caudata]|uniref:intramembrane prenyl-peptidase Rce1 n=1 Tax=Immersiella caudata TaxID=314043 RepID=A0AA40C2Z5_9PEZI|nr:hypothetical protein B0T14DRAFT_564807 [Immersiella caudata]
MPALSSLLVSRFLRPWWHKDEIPAPPPITTETASILLVLYALLYFLPFYASSTTRPSPTLSRDAPSVIRARIRSVTISCFFCLAATAIILTNTAGVSPSTILHLTGIWPLALLDTLRVLSLTALLFLGPLFHYFIVDSGWQDWLRLTPFHELHAEWTTWRNIVIGPVTEEFLFRSASIPLMLIARTSISKTIFLSPIIFGLAHVHHFYEFRLTHPEVPAAAAFLRSIFQFAYTTLFGAYATFLYVRSGSLLAACAVHAFCNCMGLPKLWGRVRRYYPALRSEESGNVLWTVTYYIFLVAGAVLWYRNLWVLTESENALIDTSDF